MNKLSTYVISGCILAAVLLVGVMLHSVQESNRELDESMEAIAKDTTRACEQLRDMGGTKSYQVQLDCKRAGVEMEISE